jgi:hypothetical protein
MKKTVTVFLATLLTSLAFSVQAATSITIDGKQYNTMEVDGETYILDDGNTLLRRGHSLQAGVDGHQLVASGALLVEADDNKARALAKRYGLQFQQSIDGIALLEAPSTMDLNDVAAKIRQEGVEVEIELAGPKQRPK